MTVQIKDSDGTVRLSGDLLAAGGAVGDVLTQQADGTYTPAPGGSQPQFVPEAILTRAATQNVPGGEQYTALTGWTATYNPDGYYTANLPEFGGPGFKIPTDKGGVHRVSFFCEHTFNSIGLGQQYYVRRAIAFLNLEETRDEVAVISVGGSVQISRGVSSQVFVGEMDDEEECQPYMKQNSGANIEIRIVTSLMIERLVTS